MITVQGISKFLGKKELFENVSFHISPGERIGLIGPNGAGKTTLFSILMGMTEPDTGGVIKSKHLSLGYLPQQWSPVEGKTVLAHAMDIHEKAHNIRAELQSLQDVLGSEADQERAREM
ncbi:MAG: ATP-binding cassette domain-containing protein, partial [Acidobacteriota bacterium]